MRSPIRILLAATLLCGLVDVAVAASPAVAPPMDESMTVLLKTIRANRKALVAANLGLTAEQATVFWPVYDRYQKEMNAVGDRMAAVIEDYSAHFRDLSNEKALELSSNYLDAESERLKIRRTYLDELAKILPGRTVARFFQIENKMDAVIRYDLAATIPVVEEPGAPDAK
jgi:hypothetical protein